MNQMYFFFTRVLKNQLNFTHIFYQQDDVGVELDLVGSTTSSSATLSVFGSEYEMTFQAASNLSPTICKQADVANIDAISEKSVSTNNALFARYDVQLKLH